MPGRRYGVAIAIALCAVALAAPAGARQGKVLDVPQPKTTAYQFPERLEGDFTQYAESPLAGGTETTTITGHVIWRIKLDQPVGDVLPPMPRPDAKPAGERRDYQAVTVKLNLKVTGSASGMVGTCEHSGSVDVTPTVDERRQLELTIDAQAQAWIKLTLSKPDVAYDVKYTCKGPIKAPAQTSRQQGLTVSLGGPYFCPLTDKKFVGRTNEPIHAGPQIITGSWSFTVDNGLRREPDVLARGWRD